MSSSKPTWKRLGERTAYKGRVHIVEHDIELPNGELSKYEVDHGASFAACVVIKTKDGKIILTHQYRFPLDKWIYDLPGGGKKGNETPEETADRECREEVGIEPVALIKLATFYPNPARTDWPIHVFYCDDYTEVAKIDSGDTSEQVERIMMTAEELQGYMDSLEIVDPSLLIGWNIAVNKGYFSL